MGKIPGFMLVRWFTCAPRLAIVDRSTGIKMDIFPLARHGAGGDFWVAPASGPEPKPCEGHKLFNSYCRVNECNVYSGDSIWPTSVSRFHIFNVSSAQQLQPFVEV